MRFRVTGKIDPEAGFQAIEVLHVARRIWVHAAGLDNPYDVKIEVVLVRDRWRVRAVTIEAKGNSQEDTEVGIEVLREIPVGRFARVGIASAVGWLSPTAGVDREALRSAGPTREGLRVIAAVYRLTQLAGAAPTLSVAEYLQCSRSTAARWIRAARDEGLLGPAIYGKAGERPKPRRRKKS